MKLNREELELRILKHLVSSAVAVNKSKSMGITEEHFIHQTEGTEYNLHSNLFKFIGSYFDKSDGSLLTSLVLENKLVAMRVEDALRAKFALLWEAIQEEDEDPNELHDLLEQIKRMKAIKMWSDMFSEANDVTTETTLEDGLEFVLEKAAEIQTELSDDIAQKSTFDITECADDFVSEYVKRRDHPELYEGIKSGVPQIDEKTFGWMPAQITVLLAPSSGGKSVVLMNWALAAHNQGKKILYFSFEMESYLCEVRHISRALQVKYSDIKGLRLDEARLAAVRDELIGMKGGPYFEYDIAMEDPTSEHVEERIRELIHTKGKPDLVVVDYMGNMRRRSSRRDAKPWEQQGDAFEHLKLLAYRWNLPILTAQQVNRETIRDTRKQKESGKSTAYYQDAASGDQRLMHLAHYVIGIEPDKENMFMTFHPVKMRDAQFDAFGCKVDPEHNGIYPLTDDEVEMWRGLRNDLKAGTKDGASQGPRVGSDSKGNTTVEWRGETNIFSAADLTIKGVDHSAPDWTGELGGL